MISTQAFEKLVWEAIFALPEKIRKRMENVAIVIDDWTNQQSFLGLYQGVPQTQRHLGYYVIFPDKITIFKIPIERQAKDINDLKNQVRRVVWHEIGHHFGISEKEIRKLEQKWQKEGKI